MRPRYWQALTVAAVGVAAMMWGIATDGNEAVGLMVLASGAVPVAVSLVISGRLEARIPIGSLAGGGTIGPLVAVLSHVFVFGFAYLFFFGFAEEATRLLEAFRMDPDLVEVASSPWTVLFFFELVLVAPLTEEIGKALGGWTQRPASRPDAFMAGVAAGVGFAIVENVLYASGGLFLGPDWEAVAAVRTLGAAVHPLASGLVLLGWWEWRNGGDLALLFRRFLTGAGVHALWNGSIVALGIVGEAYGIESLLGLGSLGIVYSAGLGALAFAALWRMSRSVAEDQEVSVAFNTTDLKTIGGWVLITTTTLIPVVLLFIAYPDWVGGPGP